MDRTKILLRYCFYLLARRNYSVAEISQKLHSKKQATSAEIAVVLERLQKLKFLDDKTFAKSYIQSSLRRKPQGARLLQLGLKKKGIAPDLIRQVLAGAQDQDGDGTSGDQPGDQPIDELQLAREALKKKIKTLGPEPSDTGTKTAHHFQAKPYLLNNTSATSTPRTGFVRSSRQKRKEKLYRFLLSRGFTMATVMQVLHEESATENENEYS